MVTNAQWVIISAAITLLISGAGVYLQSRRDKNDYMTKLVPLLENRIDKQETQIANQEARWKQAQEVDAKRQAAFDETLYKLRVIEADRANILAERLVMQKKLELLIEERDQLKKEVEAGLGKVEELNAKILKLESRIKECETRLGLSHDDEFFDPRSELSE